MLKLDVSSPFSGLQRRRAPAALDWSRRCCRRRLKAERAAVITSGEEEEEPGERRRRIVREIEQGVCVRDGGHGLKMLSRSFLPFIAITIKVTIII